MNNGIYFLKSNGAIGVGVFVILIDTLTSVNSDA